jgi:hypothetical protein
LAVAVALTPRPYPTYPAFIPLILVKAVVFACLAHAATAESPAIATQNRTFPIIAQNVRLLNISTNSPHQSCNQTPTPSVRFDTGGNTPLIDIELLVQHLRLRGHKIDSVTASEDSAGDFDFMIDGMLLTLSDGSTPAGQTIH